MMAFVQALPLFLRFLKLFFLKFSYSFLVLNKSFINPTWLYNLTTAISSIACSCDMYTTFFFQIEADNEHSLKQNPAAYAQALNSAARGLYRLVSTKLQLS